MKIVARAVCAMALYLTSVCACSVSPALTQNLDSARATECQKACPVLGMRLSAMVIIMNSVGCVCEPIQAPGAAVPVAGASAAAGGGAIIAAAEAVQEQQAAAAAAS